MKILRTPRMERCIGCHSCSLACARLVHKQLSWDKAGIRIQSTGGLSTGFEAMPCLAWDTEAFEKGLITEKETLIQRVIPLYFGFWVLGFAFQSAFRNPHSSIWEDGYA
jgi:hypothetical protein